MESEQEMDGAFSIPVFSFLLRFICNFQSSNEFQ